MIDPIHNQAYQEYTKVSRSKPQDVEQKFSMDSAMQENPSSKSSTDGVIYEPSKTEKTDSDKATSSGFGHTAHSYNSKASTSETTAQTPRVSASSTPTESLGTVIKRLFQNMLQSIKKVLSAIWESKPAEDAANTDAVNEDTINGENPEIIEASDLEALNAETTDAKSMDTETFNAEISATETVNAEAFDPQTIDPVLDADIKKALKAKDTDSFRALLSRDGHRIPAKNTSLLTYYDSKGNLVNLDPSDQYRILHGDRNSRRL